MVCRRTVKHTNSVQVGSADTEAAAQHQLDTAGAAVASSSAQRSRLAECLRRHGFQGVMLDALLRTEKAWEISSDRQPDEGTGMWDSYTWELLLRDELRGLVASDARAIALAEEWDQLTNSQGWDSEETFRSARHVARVTHCITSWLAKKIGLRATNMYADWLWDPADAEASA